MKNPFDIDFNDLPEDLPVFPLPRVILLPRAQLPLNIFEPRYLAMVEEAMSRQRLIGMIQPRADDSLFDIGCAGRIVSFEETDDGRYLITLKGVSRFRVKKELPLASGCYRRARAEWKEFSGDLVEDTATDVCRDTLMRKLHAYFSRTNMVCEQWDQIKSVPCEQLIATLSLVCPFGAEDKQALLEAPDLGTRAKILMALIDGCLGGDNMKQQATTCH